MVEHDCHGQIRVLDLNGGAIGNRRNVEFLLDQCGAGIGFTLALVLLAGLREESELSNIPQLIKGTAMNLIIAGILSMAFMGFAGLRNCEKWR